MERQESIEKIEKHLYAYNEYKVGIKTMQKQLDYIMPNITPSYDLRENTGGGNTKNSKTELYAIDRIEGKNALFIYEEIEKYQMIVESIDESLKALTEIERNYVTLRYFKDLPIKQIADELNCSPKYLQSVKTKVLDKLIITLKGLIQF